MKGRALIINADDLGYEPEVTRGIIESMREGVVSSTTFIVNGPHSAAAAALAKGLSVGLHLNLARWSRLSGKGEWSEAAAAELDAAGAAKETDAQIVKFEQLLGRKPTHLDVHKHLHQHAPVLEGLAKVAAAHRLPVRSIDKAMRSVLRKHKAATNDHFLGDAAAQGPAYWSLEELERQLEKLPKSGVIELMCHPGYSPKLIESGYSAQREVELQTFTNPSARAWLERLELVPVSWHAAFT